MKKIIIFIACISILNACGTTTTDNSTKTYTGTGFTVTIPSSWIDVGQKDMPHTQNSKIELALTSAEINAGFANNLVILSENITEATDSKSYAITNYVRTTGSVKEYTKLNESDFAFADNDEGKLYTFEAKYNLDTPKRKFLQTAKICDKKAYLMTIGINLDNTNVSKYETLLKSFQCTK